MNRKEYAVLDTETTRYCSKCKINKDFDLFHIRNRATGLRDRVCGDCQNEYGRNHFKNNKSQYTDRRRKYRKRRREFIVAQKDKPCFDCGVKYPYYVMDFDHRDPKDKLFLISHAGYGQTHNGKLRKTLGSHGVGEERLVEEIAKCDVVCSNCHRERTHRRRLGIE